MSKENKELCMESLIDFRSRTDTLTWQNIKRRYLNVNSDYLKNILITDYDIRVSNVVIRECLSEID